MTANQIINEIITAKEERCDKNGQDYLLLRLENREVVLVFPNQVPKSRWGDLKEGERYELTITNSQRGHQLLVEFEGEGILVW